MTIEEYKKKFEEIYEELQAEHGSVKYVLLQEKTHNEPTYPMASYNYIDCEIKF